MRKIKTRTQFIIAIALAAIGTAAQMLRPLENPDALWRIVSSECVPNEMQQGDPKPCALVDAQYGYAVLKDKRGLSQFLLIPTARVTGIEDKTVLDTAAPNYFAAAWNARHFTEDALKKKLPRQEIMLAINSQKSRTQNQMHIHIDCIRRDVRNALQKHAGEITTGWADFPVPLQFHRYRVRRVDGKTLDGIDPFLVLAEDPAAAADMGDETLAVAGTYFEGGKPGFILLADKVDPQGGDNASSAELLDHSCHVAHERGQ